MRVRLSPRGYPDLTLVSCTDRRRDSADVDIGPENPGFPLRMTISMVQAHIFHWHASRPCALHAVSVGVMEGAVAGIGYRNEYRSPHTGSGHEPTAHPGLLSK